MNETGREYPLLSACGLNCGLCPRHHTDGVSRCPGCGGEDFAEKRPPCGIISCCQRHGGIEYCYLCGEYPCQKYDGADQADSFITHRNMGENFQKAARGIEAYRAELDEKVELLRLLLERYNDGRKKSFFCTAVNLLPLADIRQAAAQLESETQPGSQKEKAALAEGMLRDAAEKRGISLTLRKKKG